ncbi:hypothetical protein QQP08_022302, partial [Theobroma cacao]
MNGGGTSLIRNVYKEIVLYVPKTIRTIFYMLDSTHIHPYLTRVCKLDAVSERERPNVKQTLIASYNTLLAPKVKAACMEITIVSAKETRLIGSHSSKEHKESNTVDLSTWFHQFNILLQRSLKERKHESFNILRVFQ